MLQINGINHFSLSVSRYRLTYFLDFLIFAFRRDIFFYLIFLFLLHHYINFLYLFVIHIIYIIYYNYFHFLNLHSFLFEESMV